MDPTTTLTGVVPFILITSAVLTLIIAAVLLWFYRRATLRGMARSAQARPDTASQIDAAELSQGQPRQLPVPLRFIEITSDKPRGHTGGNAWHIIKASQLRTVAIYLAGGLAYAIVMTLVWSILADRSASFGRSLMLITVFLWPSVITLSITVIVGTRELLMLWAGYALLLALTTVIVLQRNPELSVFSPLGLWALINLPPSLLFVLLLQDRIRSVGPLVFVFILCGVTGSILLVQYAAGNDAVLRSIVQTGYSFGLGSTALFALMLLTGFALFALLGRIVLRWLGRAYGAKLCSDRSITLDAMWMMFAVVQSIGFAFEGPLWILAAPAAFLAYRISVMLGFRVLSMNASRSQPPYELLLLRVFSLGRRSNRLFDKFSRLWRQIGFINMIAGPDLVTAAVEPHEFLAFANGKLSRRFVISEVDLDQRIRELDRRSDPDGRFRVHEFFCHDDTWRMTMQRLAAESDAILMDLRSFSETNKGCLYELKVLIDAIDLRRIVFVVDGTTNQGFLENSFMALWSELSLRSPNRKLSEPTVTFFSANYLGRNAMSVLIQQLLEHD